MTPEPMDFSAPKKGDGEDDADDDDDEDGAESVASSKAPPSTVASKQSGEPWTLDPGPFRGPLLDSSMRSLACRAAHHKPRDPKPEPMNLDPDAAHEPMNLDPPNLILCPQS